MVRRFLASPRGLRRLAWGLILGGAILWAMATLFRDRADRGDTLANLSYVLNAIGFLVVISGAAIEARVGAIFLAFAPRQARRRAILETVLGLAACLVGCVALGGVAATGIGTIVRPVLAVMLIGGLGAGLAGLFTVGWVYGLDWAGGRMSRLDQTGVEEARRRGRHES